MQLTLNNKQSSYNGFTLLELVLIIVLLGILGAVVAPRLMMSSQFSDRLQADKLVGLLRQAQLRAMNDPQAVTKNSDISRCAKVSFTSSGFSIAKNCDVDLLENEAIKNESQQGHFVGAFIDNITASPAPYSLPFTLQFGQPGAEINFLSEASLLGQPYIGSHQLESTLEITIGGKKVLIEPEGYIHAP